MAVAFRDVSVQSALEDESFSFLIPSGTQDGDVLILAAGGQKSFSGDPGPDSWTLLAQDDDSQAIDWRLWYRVWRTGDSSLIQITMTASTDESYAICAAFSGASISSPIGASSSATGGNSTSLSTSGITPAANSMLVMATMNYNGSITTSGQAVVTSDPTWTEANDLIMVSLAYGLRAASTGTGNGTATLSALPDSSGIVLLSLNPGGSSPSTSPSTSVSNSPSTSPSSSISSSPSASVSSSPSGSPSSSPSSSPSPSSSVSSSPSASPSAPPWDYLEKSSTPTWDFQDESLV
jgi:hypothetical protein